MSNAASIRPERSLELFSRGHELVKAIHAMWVENNLYRSGFEPRKTHEQIMVGIMAIVEGFDLTVAEWHYWCDHARAAREARMAAGTW